MKPIFTIPLCWPLLALLMLPGPNTRAKAWKGVTPGKSTRNQVIEKFGEPSKTFSKGGKLSDGINYMGDQAIKGALEANFYFNKHGTLFRIDVFPTRVLKKDQILTIFGKKYIERVTRQGNSFLNYWREGMVVFFDKEVDRVNSFMFTEPSTGSRGGKAN